jgi:hypothetical protein
MNTNLLDEAMDVGESPEESISSDLRWLMVVTDQYPMLNFNKREVKGKKTDLVFDLRYFSYVVRQLVLTGRLAIGLE